RPYLQGWAVVENTTDEDWSGVRMALISGRPISFQMNLYDALFIKRPIVEPELFASLRPPSYSGGRGGQNGKAVLSFAPSAPPPADRPAESKAASGLGVADKKAGDGREYFYKEALQKDRKERMNLGQSVASAASASKLGDSFQYAIDPPVSLPRQKSALLPIVGKDVAGERVSIYSERVHPKFPLLG